MDLHHLILIQKIEKVIIAFFKTKILFYSNKKSDILYGVAIWGLLVLFLVLSFMLQSKDVPIK
jgi:hypothetical protein